MLALLKESAPATKKSCWTTSYITGQETLGGKPRLRWHYSLPFPRLVAKQPSVLVAPSAHKTPDLRTPTGCLIIARPQTPLEQPDLRTPRSLTPPNVLIFARSAGYGLLRGHEHQHASFRSPSCRHLWAPQPPQGRHRAQVQRSKGPFLFAFTVLALLRSLTRSDHVGPHRSLQVRVRGSRWTNPLGEWPAECRTRARSLVAADSCEASCKLLQTLRD